MGMPAQQTGWTADMVRALPDDGNRYEVLDGVLFVSPAPSALHQRAVAALLEILTPYCRQHQIGEAMISPADIEFSEHRVLQPDVFVVPLIEGPADPIVERSHVAPALGRGHLSFNGSG